MSVPTITHDKPTNPTADVFIDGLSVICFSKNHERAEIGFLRCEDKAHALAITIYKNGCDNIFWQLDEASGFSFDNALITVSGGTKGVGYRYENKEGKEEDPEDFRWTPDLDEIYSANLPVKSDAKDFLYTRLHIYNGTFYTKVLSTYKATLYDEANPGDVKEYNYFGKVVGSTVDEEEVIVIVTTSEGKEISSPILKKSEGSFWVYLNYRCPGHKGTGDFLLNYDVLQKPKGEPTYNLIYDSSEKIWHPCPDSAEAKARVMGIDETCQGTSGGGHNKDLPPED